MSDRDPAVNLAAPFDQGVFLLHYNRGREAFQEGRYAEARRELESAQKLRPDDPDVLNLLGLVYFKTNAFPEAEVIYRRLAKENPVAARFLAEADIWQSRFERAAPLLAAFAAEYPADSVAGHRAGSLHRSLSYADAREIDAAVAAEQRLARFDPRDAAALTTLGEIYADREQYDRARAFWDRLPGLEPGSGGAYLESATVFWDYFRFDDALRVIEEGRRKLRTPSLHAYEAGAIHEGLRQPARAVDEYVKGALSTPESEAARRRLLVLAKRPAYRTVVDRAAVSAVEGNEPPARAVALRIAVLEAQDRRSDLEQFLVELLDRTPSLELMTAIDTHAARLGFDSIRTRSLARQIDAMTDPVEKLQLRCALVRLHEARGELDVARRTLETVYADNRRILGIVRQTVDYYWRHDLRREAVDVLTRAAADAYPALRRQLTLEAAGKAVRMNDYGRGRDLLRRLLADDPFNAEYLAAMADSFAVAKDDAQLRDFYRSTIEAMRTAPLPTDERTRRMAGLRRGLIPALTRLNDHAGAIDQYIEIINRYPDDEGLLREAGRYARQHARTAQLVDYYKKTAAGSPRDYRWPMLLARLETEFEDYPAAIAAYTAASAIRPDRADFATARGALRERLLQFDAAIADYRTAFSPTTTGSGWKKSPSCTRARGASRTSGRCARRWSKAGQPVPRRCLRLLGGSTSGTCSHPPARLPTKRRALPTPPICWSGGACS